MCRNSYSPPFDSMAIPRYAGDYTFLLLFKVVSEEYSRREASCIFVVLHQFSGTTCEVKYTDAVSQVSHTFPCLGAMHCFSDLPQGYCKSLWHFVCNHRF